MKAVKLIILLLTFIVSGCSVETFDPEQLETEVLIFPNPCTSEVSINMKNKPAGTGYITIDYNDGSVKSFPFDGNIVLNVTGRKSGTYNCEIVIGEYLFRRTIIIKNDD